VIRKSIVLILLVMLLGARPAPALLVTPLDENQVSVTTISRGATRADAELAAKQDAVVATAGRVLLDDVLFRADGLLEKYLRTYADNFVSGVDVMQDNFTGGVTVLNSRVYIDYAKLVADLKEKKFTYKPAHRPLFAVFIDEQLDGQVIPEAPARQILESALAAQGIKSYEGTIEAPSSGTNVFDDPVAFEQARIAAERRNIEIIFTGRARTTLREERKVYLDTFYFYDTEMEIHMIRVDTGEKLLSVTARGSASARDQGDAVSSALDRASQNIAQDFIADYRAFWPQVVQAKAGGYKILLTGVSDELVRIITQHLGSLGSDTTIELRKKFGSSAVLVVETSASRDQVLEVIRRCPFPTLYIVREQGRDKLEVQVSG